MSPSTLTQTTSTISVVALTSPPSLLGSLPYVLLKFQHLRATRKVLTTTALQHYGPDTYNKNWIYRSDDWLLAERWELLINNRDSIPFVEIITWNDYGESHYVGPIEGDQPNSQAWVDGFDHQGEFVYLHTCQSLLTVGLPISKAGWTSLRSTSRHTRPAAIPLSPLTGLSFGRGSILKPLPPLTPLARLLMLHGYVAETICIVESVPIIVSLIVGE